MAKRMEIGGSECGVGWPLRFGKPMRERDPLAVCRFAGLQSLITTDTDTGKTGFLLRHLCSLRTLVTNWRN